MERKLVIDLIFLAVDGHYHHEVFNFFFGFLFVFMRYFIHQKSGVLFPHGVFSLLSHQDGNSPFLRGQLRSPSCNIEDRSNMVPLAFSQPKTHFWCFVVFFVAWCSQFVRASFTTERNKHINLSFVTVISGSSRLSLGNRFSTYKRGKFTVVCQHHWAVTI